MNAVMTWAAYSAFVWLGFLVLDTVCEHHGTIWGVVVVLAWSALAGILKAVENKVRASPRG